MGAAVTSRYGDCDPKTPNAIAQTGQEEQKPLKASPKCGVGRHARRGAASGREAHTLPACGPPEPGPGQT